MPSLGQTLRDAREAKGLTVAELSKKTNIMGKQLSGIENDDFSSIPEAPFYVKSFIKTFATQVGLDSNEMVALYFEQQKAGAHPPAPVAELKVRKSKSRRRSRKEKTEKDAKPRGLMPIRSEAEPSRGPAPDGPADDVADGPADDVAVPASRPASATPEPAVTRGQASRPLARDPAELSGSSAVAASQPPAASVPAAAAAQASSSASSWRVAPPREPRPALSAVLAAKWKAINWPRLRIPAWMKIRPSLAGFTIPFLGKKVDGPTLRKALAAVAAVLVLAGITYLALLYADHREVKQADKSSQLGDLRTNPVITDPPDPYFITE